MGIGGFKIPANVAAIDSRQLMAQAVADQFAIVTATPPPDPNALRRPMAGDLGPLQTARLP
jgi:hypothetical protein